MTYKVTTLLYNIAGNNADQTKLTLATVAPPITFARKLRTRSSAPAFVSTRREQAIKRLQPFLSPQNCWSPQGLRLLLKRSWLNNRDLPAGSIRASSGSGSCTDVRTEFEPRLRGSGGATPVISPYRLTFTVALQSHW